MSQPDKKQKIQWDEETIAEHDKERGSRQKIDEAPTPFRYQSESDQSECESDGERLAREDLEASEETAGKNSPTPSHPQKKKTSLTNPSNVSDSWEAINAKLQYEKHLQDNAGGNNTPTGPILGKPNDSLLRSQFYQNGGSSSNSNFNNQPSSQNGSPRVSMASGGKIQDLQSNFGEILNPAPAAFSPQFTNKNFRRSNGGKPSILVSGGSTSADDEGAGAGAEGSSGGAAWKRKPLLSPEKPHKSVFIKAFGEGEGGTAAGEGGEAMGVSPSHSADNAHHEGQHSLSASHDEDPPSGEKKQFLNKRAGHYNEFKVLQAMRAKLAAEEEEEDETDS